MSFRVLPFSCPFIVHTDALFYCCLVLLKFFIFYPCWSHEQVFTTSFSFFKMLPSLFYFCAWPQFSICHFSPWLLFFVLVNTATKSFCFQLLHWPCTPSILAMLMNLWPGLNYVIFYFFLFFQHHARAPPKSKCLRTNLLLPSTGSPIVLFS